MKDVLKNLTQNGGVNRVEIDWWVMFYVKSFPLSQPIGQLLCLGFFELFTLYLQDVGRVCLNPQVIALSVTAAVS